MPDDIISLLIIEDNHADSRLIQETLKETGSAHFRYQVAETLTDGIAKMNTTIDVVLLDLNLPDSNGINTLKIFSNLYEVTTIILSGIRDIDLANESIKFGAQDYLVKGTFDYNSLTRSIKYSIERFRQTRELIKNEEKVHIIFQTAPNLILILDGENRIKICNEKIKAYLGYNINEVLGKNIGDFIHPDFRIKASEILEEVKNDGYVYNRECTMVCKNSSSITVFVNSSVYKTSSEKDYQIICIIDDITERKIYETNLVNASNEITRQRDLAKEYLNIAGVIILIIDTEGIVTLVNKKGCEILGYNGKNIIGKNWFDNFIPDGTKEQIADIHKKNIINQEGFSEYNENLIKTSADEIRYIAWHNRLLKDRKGEITGVLSSGIDITKRKSAEARDQLFTEVLEILNTTNSTTNTVKRILDKIKQFTDFDSIAIRLNDGNDFPYYLANGFTDSFIASEQYLCVQDLSGNTIYDENGKPELYCMCGAVLRGRSDAAKGLFTDGGSFWTNNTTELVAKDSKYFNIKHTRNRCNIDGYESVALIPLKSDGEIIGLLQLNNKKPKSFTLDLIHFFEGLGASIGITLSRRQAEEEIKFKNTILTTQQEASIDGILAVDDSGKIISWNKRFVEIWEIPPEIPATGFDDLTIKSIIDKTTDSEKFYEKVNYLYNHQNEKSFDQIYLKNGKILDSYSAPITGSEGKYYGRLWNFRDITERRKSEKMLVESEKMAEIAHLAAGVAHEFNNILAIIKSSSQLLLLEESIGNLTFDNRIKEELSIIDRQTKRGAEIVSNLMVFSKPDKEEKESVLIEEIIDEVIKLQKKQFEIENIKIVRNYNFNKKILLNSGQIQQVFLNLSINALHAIKPKGRGKIEITTGQENGNILITFCDTGIGMSNEIRENIFLPFFTTKGANATDSLGLRGTGLGLSVTYSIIKESNGKIIVESEPGKGTDFRIYLPIEIAKPDNSNTEKEIAEKGPNNFHTDLKILIVDDEKNIADNISRILKAYKFTHIDICYSPVVALEKSKTGNYDIFFMDVMMPEMKGDVLLENLLKNIKNRDSNIIIMSGDYNDQIDKIISSSEKYFFLMKPFGPREILQIFNKIHGEKTV